MSIELCEYFNNLPKNQLDKMLEILNGESRITLRLLDFIMYHVGILDDEHREIQLNYKKELGFFGRSLFDPFKRINKFNWRVYGYDIEIETSIGQLNFFKWCFDNEIINYVDRISIY